MATSFYRGFVALITFCFVAFLFQGLLTGYIDQYLASLRNDILVQVTIADVYLSIGLACVLISVLERKWWAGLLVFVPALVIGGPTIGLYLLWRLPALLRVVQSSDAA